MKSINSPQNIIYYWDAVERFTPHKLDTKNKLGYVESIKQEVLWTKDTPWKSREVFCYKQTPDKTRVYNIFLGIVNCSDISRLIKEMLESSEKDYHLQNDNEISCLCTFQLNNYGEILENTFAIPDYFISMACLNKKKKHPRTWLDLAPTIYKRVEDAYNNWVDILQNRPNRSVVFEDLKSLLADIINVSDIIELHNMTRNNVVIYSSNIPVPNKFKFKYDKKNAKEKFLNVTYYEEIMKTITNSDLSILNSFYIDDIKIVSDALKDNNETIGIGLKQYLGLIHKDEKYDLRTDKLQMRQLSNPEFLPSSRWPISNKVALSIAQQIAVNLAISETKGLFSVNGPPGTGKSTLLRDIISEVITNRAQILADFTNPKDAFTNSATISVDRFKYKACSLDSRLLGFEIVIASTNNTAVENISKEIPRLSEIDQSYDLDYFSEIATYVNAEECWGLGSAALGNKTNCYTFFEKFWNKIPEKNSNNKIDDNYGLEYLLNIKKPQSDWTEDRQRFLSTLAEFTELKSELIEFKTKLDKYTLSDFDIKQDKILSQINDINDEIKIHKTSLENCEDRLLQNTSNIEQNKFQLEETKKLEPKWYIVFLEFFKQESSYQKWSNRCSDILEEIFKLVTESTKLKSEILKLRRIISGLEDEISNLLQKLEELSETIDKNNEYINLMTNKYSWSSKIADENFWQLSDKEIQLSSPWIHQKLQDLRARLFVEAMKLHYSFIVNSSEYIVNNLRLIRQVIVFGNLPDSKEMLKHLWATFFLVVPSVSTTFASFGKLFRGLYEAESLGWLLIDEAGQSSPQEVLGAIYRTKRIIVVGDPLQIPPVVTISKAINNTLMKYYNVGENWSVLEESVQTLSDRVNTYGAYINKGGNNQWVGCPLRVHRRCLEPMFSVANKIAYDGLMIQATTKAISTFDQSYLESQWIDVQGYEFNGHWCKQEGKEVLKIIFSIIEQHKSIMPDVYIISPFKSVADKMKKLLKDKTKYLLNNLKPEEESMFNKWAYKSIGTIHKFQGKQSKRVILILGGNPSKTGAINWASNYPNILNVALTRAKHKIFVVGNYKLWASKPNFQVLADVISVTKVLPEEEKSLNKKEPILVS